MTTSKFGIARKAFFSIEGIGSHLVGYTLGMTWNGAACPFFECETADKIARAFGESNGEGASMVYDQKKDAYIEKYGPDVDGDCVSEYSSSVLMTEDGEKTVYAIGAFAWTWWLDDEWDKASIEYAIIASARNTCGPRQGSPDAIEGFDKRQLREFVVQYRDLCRIRPDVHGTPHMNTAAFESALKLLGA